MKLVDTTTRVVEPTTRTTLLLNRNHQAFSFCSARAAMRHLITGRVKGMDANGNIVSWDGADMDQYPSVESSLSWSLNNVALFDNHPYLRSAPNTVTGEESRRYIPTIALCSHHFGFHVRKGETVSLKSLYSIYKGTCQYCLNSIPFNSATKDHVVPKSKGGTNHDFNLVLACRKCNTEKDNIFPYFDIEGNEVKPRKMLRTGVLVPDADNVRKEWKPYLYMD